MAKHAARKRSPDYMGYNPGELERMLAEGGDNRLIAQADMTSTMKWLSDSYGIRSQSTPFNYYNDKKRALERVGHRFRPIGSQPAGEYPPERLSRLFNNVYDGYVRQFRRLPRAEQETLKDIYRVQYRSDARIFPPE